MKARRSTRPRRRISPPRRTLAPRRSPSHQSSRDVQRLILDYIDAIVYWVDISDSPMEGTLRFMGGRVDRIIGHSARDCIKDPQLWGQSIHPADIPSVESDTRTLVESALPVTRTYRMLHKSTRGYRWIEDKVVPILGRHGKVKAFFGVARDVTDIRTKEEELRQSQKMEAIGLFAGGIAHDFNNMLTVIHGHIDLLLSKLPPDSPLRTDLNEIQLAGERAAKLTHHLLAFGRRQVLDPQLVDVNGIVRGLSAMLRRTIPENIEITTVLGPEAGSVRVDPTQLEQVIFNLVLNAQDAMPEGGKLSLTTESRSAGAEGLPGAPTLSQGAYSVITVRDTGSGIPQDVLPRIFDPFFTTKDPAKGSGLGLSVAYGIVKQSSGAMAVDTEVGKGSEFRIYLPRAETKAAVAKIPSRSPSSGRGTETILLVEDEDMVRSLARTALETHGYNVIEASNGLDGLARYDAADVAIDLLLTDVIMPQMSGPDLAKRIREKRPGLPVLFTSGYRELGKTRYSEGEQIGAFLQKPFRIEDLLQKVRELLEQSIRLKV